MWGRDCIPRRFIYCSHVAGQLESKNFERKYKSVMRIPARIINEQPNAWLRDFKAKTLTFPDFNDFIQTPTEDLTAYAQTIELNCKNFEWYIDRFADIYHKAGLMPETVFQLESQRAPGHPRADRICAWSRKNCARPIELARAIKTSDCNYFIERIGLQMVNAAQDYAVMIVTSAFDTTNKLEMALRVLTHLYAS